MPELLEDDTVLTPVPAALEPMTIADLFGAVTSLTLILMVTALVLCFSLGFIAGTPR